MAACRASQQVFCRSLVPLELSDDAGDACLGAVKAAYKDAALTADEVEVVW